MTQCAKCGAAVGEGMLDCPRCGIVLSKAQEAADRELLRRRMTAGRPAPTPVSAQEKVFPWRRAGIIAVIAICLIGGVHWATTDRDDDLAKLATEVSNAPAADNELSDEMNYRMFRLLIKYGAFLAVAVSGYAAWKARHGY